MNKAGLAWQYTSNFNELPFYKFTVSVATINQAKADATGSINLLVRRLQEVDRRTKATHVVYTGDTSDKVFDERSELLVSVNRQKVRNCFLMNGYFTLVAEPLENKILKKLNAYTYRVFEDNSMLKEISDKKPQLGFAYLKLQISFEKEEFDVGKMFSFNEQGEQFFNLYIDKVKVLDLADPDKKSFYLAAQKNKQNEYRLFFTPEINYKTVDFVFNFSRRAFMKLGMSDNNGDVIFVAYPNDHGMLDGGDFEIFYAMYHPDNMIREKNKFTDGSGWKRENMNWIN